MMGVRTRKITSCVSLRSFRPPKLTLAQSHLTYSEVPGGPCPASHPNVIPELYLLITWDLKAVWTQQLKKRVCLHPAFGAV